MNNRKVLIILGIIIIISIFLVGGRLVYFIFYCYMLMILSGIIYTRIGAKKIEGEIKLPSSEIVSGEKVSISYVIKNKSSLFFPFLQLYSSIEESVSGHKKKVKVFSLDREGTYTETTSIICNRRGYYKTGQAYILINDIFNIFHLKKKIHKPIYLKVYPKIIPISYFAMLGNLQMGELIVKNPIFEDYSSLADLRFYRSGDSVKKIDWKISAKKDDLVVKLHDLRGDTEVAVLINNAEEDYIYDKNRVLEDRAVEIAVSIIDFCIEKNIKVSLVSEDGYYNGKVKGDSKVYMKMFLENLIEFSPQKGKNLWTEISNFALSGKQGLTSLIISPRISNKEAILIADMKMKNINPLIIVINGERDNKFFDKNKEISKKLKNENIPVYLTDTGEYFGKILGEDDEKINR